MNRIPYSARDEFTAQGHNVYTHNNDLNDAVSHDQSHSNSPSRAHGHSAKHGLDHHASDPDDHDQPQPLLNHEGIVGGIGEYDTAWVDRDFPLIRGTMKHHLANFVELDVENPSIIYCVEECFERDCKEVLYKRTTKTCYMHTSDALGTGVTPNERS